MNSTPALSKREVALLADWERIGITRVTTRDLAQKLDVGKPAASVILARLARKGALDHIGRGVYSVRPMRAIAIPWATSALVLIAHLLDGHDYYVGGPIALTTHRLTEQVFHGVVDVFLDARRLHRKLGHAQVIFHTHRWPEAYSLGITDITVSSTTVRMSDPERTLLDIVARPSLLGSARSAIATIEKALDRIDLDRLIAYGARWPQSATRQRLGAILERAGVNRKRLAPLLPKRRPTHVVPLFHDEPISGPIHSPWRVRLNDGGDPESTSEDPP